MGDKNYQLLLDLIGSYDNLDEPEPVWNRPQAIIGIGVTFTAVSWICVIFRLYTRLRIVRSPGWDDFFVVLFMLCGTAGTVTLCLASQYGLGKHFLTLTFPEMAVYLKYFYIANASYPMSTSLIKISLLFQYLRLFDKGTTRLLIKSLIVFTAVWGFVFSFLAWFPCFPPRTYWTVEMWSMNAKCYGFGDLRPAHFFAVYAAHTSSNIVLDLLVLLILFPLYFAKETPRRTKMGLSVLLFMGGIVNILSMWRTYSMIKHRATTWPTFDPTWYGPEAIMLGVMEVEMANITAAIPIFWPVLTACVEKIFVTHEIKITTEERYDTTYGSEDRPNSRSGSINSQSRLNSAGGNNTEMTTKNHYMNDFIMDQVDPLRAKTTILQVQSEIVSEGSRRKESIWARKNSTRGLFGQKDV